MILFLVAETEELLMEKLSKWKKGMEFKGLRVNIGKTKVMRCQVGIGQAEQSAKYPCGVCKKGVGRPGLSARHTMHLPRARPPFFRGPPIWRKK